MEYLLVAVFLGGFGYFIYTRVKKARAERDGDGGDRPVDPRPPEQER